jgi:hypothetical protein
MAMACGALAIACASTSIAMVHSTSVLAAGMFADHGAQRQRAADATIGELEAQRTSYLSYLAARCHLSQAALDTLLADALQSKSLPRFAAEVPRELPVAVTLDRNDQVADALQNLRMHSDIANTAYARVVDARTDFKASKQSRDRGDISEVQLMEDFQGLLLDLHVLAAANDELAMAWVVFTGNAQSMRNDTAIDAMTSPQTTQLPFLHKVSRKLRNP